MVGLGCGSSCPKPKPIIVERIVKVKVPCMSPITEQITDLFDWPDKNPDGTYTVTEKQAEEMAVWLYFVFQYLETNYAKCRELSEVRNP